ncbi:hypothetical protein, partial [Moorella sp. Hama-1]|uniref:hypothetical protein n=1 Tax=Moorella sp. Hama-1 TaxID=2138101 RepID=UPI001F174939
NSLGEMIRHGISNSWLEDSLYFYFLLRLKIIFSCSQGAECENYKKQLRGQPHAPLVIKNVFYQYFLADL